MRFTLKLKDKRLVERWEKLLPYAQAAPHRPEFAAYHNVLRDDEVMIMRQKGAPSFVYFLKGDVVEIDGVLDEGGTAVMQEFKISTRFPFALAYHTTASETETRPGPWQRFVHDMQRIRMFFGTDLLAPTAEELDDLLAHLDGAERRVCSIRSA